MKKVAKRKGDIIIQGLSSNNGIAFTVSKNFFGPLVVNGPTVATTISEGKLFSETTRKWYDEEFWNKQEAVERRVKEIVGKIIFICFPLIVIFSGTYWMRLFTSLLFILISMLMDSPVFMLFIGSKVLRKKEYINFTKYHAAEHAVINGFYDLGRVPTKEEIKGYSNLSLRCGSLDFLYRIAVWWIPAIVVLLPNYWCTLFVGLILYILIEIIHYKGKLYFMEFLVTSNPTDLEYEVAISGLTEALEEYRKHNNMTFTHLPMGMPPVVIEFIHDKEK